MRTKKSLVVILLVSLFALALSSSALAWGRPRPVLHRTIVVTTVPVKPIRLETVDVDIQKVLLDKAPIYAEATDAKGQTLKVYLGLRKLPDGLRDRFVVGKHLQVTGLRGPSGFVAVAIKVDGKTIWVRRFAAPRGVGYGYAPAPHRIVRRGHVYVWRPGHGAGLIAKEGICPLCGQPAKTPAQAQAQAQTPAPAPADAPAQAPAQAPDQGAAAQK